MRSVEFAAPNNLRPCKVLVNVARILDWELLAFVGGIGAVVFLQLLQGQINLRGVLLEKDGSEALSPARVQLLVATLAASMQYLSKLADASGNALPEVGAVWVYLLGGSSGIYAARKIYGRWKKG